MNGRIIPDWRKVDMRTPAGRSAVRGALQMFMDAPRKDAKIKAAMQMFSQTGDFPENAVALLKTFQATDFFDNAWESCFDVIDMTALQNDSFSIADVEDGLTFQEVKIGEKAPIFKFSGTKTSVGFATYMAGLQWSWQLFEDRQYWTLEKNAIAFRNKWFRNRADIAYALIEAIPSARDINWAAAPGSVPNTDGNYEALRDQKTINAAALDVISKCKNKGYGVGPNSPLVLLAPLALKQRIQRALGPINSALSAAPGVTYNITPLFTLGLSATDKYYVGIPGQKNMWGDRLYLNIQVATDITTASDLSVGRGRFGGAIGDTQQWARCKTA